MSSHITRFLLFLSVFFIFSQQKVQGTVAPGVVSGHFDEIRIHDFGGFDQLSASIESITPVKHSYISRLGRGKNLSFTGERQPGLVYLPSFREVALILPDRCKRICYAHKDALFSFLQSLLYPKHSFW